VRRKGNHAQVDGQTPLTRGFLFDARSWEWHLDLVARHVLGHFDKRHIVCHKPSMIGLKAWASQVRDRSCSYMLGKSQKVGIRSPSRGKDAPIP
jgi:hypothetical protein